MAEHGNRPPCPHCGGIVVIKKGFAKRKNRQVRVWRCKSCKHSFSEKRLRQKCRLPKDLAKNYINNVTSLKGLKELKDDNPSMSTYYRNIQKQVKEYPKWRDLLKMPEFRRKWGFIMGIDTTTLKIKGYDYYYLHVADMHSSDHLVYEILEREDAISIKSALKDLRSAGYVPKVVVTDLAPEILSAVKETFPQTTIQGCLFHLQRWLNKQLPTKKKNLNGHALKLWQNVKQLIMHVAKAQNVGAQKRYLNDLEHIRLDEKSHFVVQAFLKNLQYYHVLEELIWLGCKREYMYNNLCERSIEAIKYLKRRMRGFKRVETTSSYINAYWFLKRTEKRASQQREITIVSKHNIPLTLFEKRVDLTELSEERGIDIEILKEAAEKAGYMVIKNIAFSPEWLREANDKLRRKKPKTLKDGLKIIGEVPWSIFKFLGFDIRGNSLDSAKILLVPVSDPLSNRTKSNC